MPEGAELRARGRRVRAWWILAIVVSIGLALIAVAVGPLRALVPGCMFAASGSCIRILFIGNSYTSVNDLPATVMRLAQSNGLAVEVSAVDPPGATLLFHISSQSVFKVISGTAWTAVVLQEASQIPSVADLRDEAMIPAETALVSAVRAAGARPYLFEAWAHRDGWAERNLSRAAMQAAIADSYARVSLSLGVDVAPVGSAWKRAETEAPQIELWQADGSHPTKAGTYLAACVLYRTVLGLSPVGIAESDGLSSADAAILQQIAAESVP